MSLKLGMRGFSLREIPNRIPVERAQ